MHRYLVFQNYNTAMQRIPLLLTPCFLVLLTFACTTTSTPQSAARFFYMRTGNAPALVLQPSPDSAQPLSEIPLKAPADCGFWSLTPAPAGSLVAVEWECAYGPAVQVLDTLSGKIHFLFDDPTMDYRLLDWNADGRSIYLKAGMLQAFSNGMSLGSELWLSDTNGAGGRKILSDAENILGLMRYSPNADQIAYIRLPDSETAFPAGELWVMDSDGENARLAATAD